MKWIKYEILLEVINEMFPKKRKKLYVLVDFYEIQNQTLITCGQLVYYNKSILHEYFSLTV